MSLILHELAHSPFCIPLRRIFEAWSVPYDRVQVSAWDRRPLIELTSGAYYQVPILQHGEKIIHELPDDPLAVPHFVDGTFCEGRLFPNHAAGLNELLIEHIENELEGTAFKLSDPGVVDAMEDRGERIMVERHKERKFGAGCVSQWKQDAPALMHRWNKQVQPYEKRLEVSRYLLGNEPVYADFALYGVVSNLQFGGFHRLSEDLPNLRRWESDLEKFSAQ